MSNETNDKWIVHLNTTTWNNPISVNELLVGRETTISKKVRVAFQIFHTDVPKLSQWKCHAVDHDLRRPIYATEFPGAAKYMEWTAQNMPHLLAMFTSHVDRKGKQYLYGHHARDVHQLMCFSAWLGQVVPSYKVPPWCTAKAIEPAKGIWQVWCCKELSPEDIVKVFDKGADAVEAARPPDFTQWSDPNARFTSMEGVEVGGAVEADRQTREQYLREVSE